MSTPFDLTGKVAIVTGSSRGIGKATAELLARMGARVVISSRKQDACDAVAAAINAEHGEKRAVAIAASISDKAALERLVADTRERLGEIDVLVLNAASNPYYGPQAGISDDQFRKVLDNNILANHWLIAMVAPEMRARRSGSIVIVSSIAGLRGTTTIGAYGISKAADMAMTRNLAHEFGPDNVRVNTIAPGLIRTDFARALLEDPEREKATASQVPLRRVGEPPEIASGIAFLASEASAFMTGQVLVIDGGATI